jgi:hypothetical protein
LIIGFFVWLFNILKCGVKANKTRFVVIPAAKEFNDIIIRIDIEKISK